MTKRKLKRLEHEILEEEKIVWHILKRGIHAFIVIIIFWAIGSSFFMAAEKMNFYDAIYHAAMIMTGMGPAIAILTPAAKVFSAFYAIFSIGIVIASIIYIFEPIFRGWHRRTYKEFHKKR